MSEGSTATPTRRSTRERHQTDFLRGQPFRKTSTKSALTRQPKPRRHTPIFTPTPTPPPTSPPTMSSTQMTKPTQTKAASSSSSPAPAAQQGDFQLPDIELRPDPQPEMSVDSKLPEGARRIPAPIAEHQRTLFDVLRTDRMSRGDNT